MCHILFILFGLTLSFFLYPKGKVAFDRILHEQGYANSEITSIIQGPKGFIWFGTSDGLNRYDGYNCVVYKHDPTKSNSISYSSVVYIYLDKQGILWIGTENGLNRFDWETETFERYLHNKDDPESLSDNEIEVIYEGSKGYLWIGTHSGGLNRLDKKTEVDRETGLERETVKFKHFKHDSKNPNSLCYNRVKTIFEDSRGVFWVGTEKGLNRFDRDTEKFEHYYHKKSEPGTISNDYIWSIHEDRGGNLWFGTWGGGLNQYIRDKDRFVHYLIEPTTSDSSIHNRITSIYEDRHGTLWIGTRGSGLCKFIRESESFVCYQNDPNDPRSLSHNMVNTIFEDKTGILWIGTVAGGINKYNRRKEKFLYYCHNPNNSNSLSDNMVLSIYKDPNEAGEIFWIGTYCGFNRLDRGKGSFTQFQHDAKDPYSISNNVVRFIFKDKNNILWLGTDDGLNRFDRKTRKFISFKHDDRNPKTISHGRIITINEDKKGRLWVGTSHGLNLFHRINGSFKRFLHKPENPKSISSDSISCIHEQLIRNDFVLWIGTYGGGLNRFDVEKNEFFHYRSNPDSSNSLINDNIRVIYEDNNGIFWLGTDGGLNRFDPKTGEFKSFKKKDQKEEELAVYKICGILEDEAGCLWLSTNNGLNRFNIEKETFKNFNVGNGLPIRYFNEHAYYKSRNNEMFFGGVNGFTSFFSEAVKENPYKPDIMITDFRIFNKPIRFDINDTNDKFKKSIIETDKIVLSYQKNFFSFEFSALDYTWPEHNKYSYKMEGFDKEWVETDAQTRLASYTNLSPGKYIFKVKGSNNDGVWNENGKSIKIIITPPFWQTWWFRILVGLFLIFCIIGSYKWRTKLLRDKLEEQERVQRILKQSRDEMEKSRNLAEFRNAENEKLIAAISSLFIAVDTNGKVFQWNHSSEKFFGIPEAEIKEQLLVDLLMDYIPAKKLDKIIEMGLHSEKSSNNIEIPVHLKKNNDSKLLLANISPIMDNKGKKFGFLLLAEDITHRKKEQMQRFLSQKLEALGQMAAGIAHEIRSPLQYIGDNGRFLQETFDALMGMCRELKNKIEKIGESGNQIAVEELSQLLYNSDFDFFIEEIPKASEQLVNGVMRVSNIVKSMNEFSYTGNEVDEKSDLNELLKSTLVVAHNRIKKIADLETEYAPDLPHIPCGKGELNQVFLNLLINAADAITETGKRGVIKISTKRKDNELIVEISDNGIGIPDEIKDKIFTPFFTTKDIGKGTGQGLSFSHRIVVERHKGKLYFESKVNEGTIFYIHLPIEENLNGFSQDYSLTGDYRQTPS
jgi:PAS domain S-box-containing protein